MDFFPGFRYKFIVLVYYAGGAVELVVGFMSLVIFNGLSQHGEHDNEDEWRNGGNGSDCGNNWKTIQNGCYQKIYIGIFHKLVE